MYPGCPLIFPHYTLVLACFDYAMKFFYNKACVFTCRSKVQPRLSTQQIQPYMAVFAYKTAIWICSGDTPLFNRYSPNV
jgi:hypothetical protein